MRNRRLLLAVLLLACVPTRTRPITDDQPEEANQSEGLSVAPTPESTPDRTIQVPVVPLELQWRYEMRHLSLLAWAPLETAGPLAVGDRIYASTARGQAFYALDARTGTPKWVFHPRARIDATPAIGGGRAYLATAKGVLWGINLETGLDEWHVPLGGISTSRLLYDESSEHVVVPTGDNKVHCVDANSGTEVWTYRREPPSDLTIWGTSSPVKATIGGADAYLIGFSDGTLVAIKAATGTPLWEQRLLATGRFRDVDGDVAVLGDRSFVSAYGENMFALDRETGKIIWTAPPGGVTGVAVAEGKLIHGTDTGDVVAQDPSDGHEVWRWHLPAGLPTTPVLGGELLFVASSSRSLYALRVDTGALAWTFAPDYRVAGASAEPAVSGRHVYLVSNVGTVYAFQPASADVHYIGSWDSGTHRH